LLAAPRVFIIIVNYNGARWLSPCLDAVLQTDYGNFSVIVVDNNSTDDSRAIIQGNYASVILLAEKQNLGFSSGNNVGIRYALAHQADYVVLLNPDTKVKPSWLKALIEVGEENVTLGVLGGVQLRYDSDEWNDWTNAILSSDKKARLKNAAWLEMEWVEGACFAIKRAVLEQVGLFDSIYFSFYEELDYCRRARYHGFRTALVAGCLLHHYRGGVWQADAERKVARDYQCDKSQFIYSLTAPDKSLWANLINYVVTLGVKAKESFLAFRYRQLFHLALIQFSVWRKGAALWRKWRADRLRLSGYGFS
jgi:hypothetical protein